MLKSSSLVACAAILLAGCAGHGPPVISTGARYAVSVDLRETYRLGAADKVRMTVFNEPTLSGEFAVGSDGMVSLPLIGNVLAKDKTTAQLAAETQGRFADGFLRDPKVSMEVSIYRPFFILGEVRQPGQYPFVPGLTVWNAIATAEGLTPRARQRVVFIRRFGEKTETLYVLAPNLKVWPGDTIRLTERYF